MRLLCAIGVLIALAAVARADDEADAFRAASVKLGAGDLAGAEADFAAIADRAPDSLWADNALAEAASAAERLGDLAGARALWQRILDRYPSSRSSRRARVRVAAIDQAIGAGGRWLAVAEEHEAILRDATGAGNPEAEIARMSALVAANPDYPRAEEARLWIGETWMRLGRADLAAAVDREALAAAGDEPTAFRAGKALGDALAAAGDLDGAEATYRGLLGRGDDLDDRVLREALDGLDTERTRATIVIGCWIAIALWLALVLGYAVRGRRLRALARPPIELAYYAPVAAVLVLVSLSGNEPVGVAVRWVLGAGVVVTWLTGASLAGPRRLRAPIALALALGAAAAVAGVTYLVLYRDGLLDLVTATWRAGADR